MIKNQMRVDDTIRFDLEDLLEGNQGETIHFLQCSDRIEKKLRKKLSQQT